MAEIVRIEVQISEGKGKPITQVFESTEDSPLLAHDRARDFLRLAAVARKGGLARDRAEAAAVAELERAQEKVKTIRLTPSPVIGRAHARGQGSGR